MRRRLTEAQFTRVRHNILWFSALLVVPVATGISIYNGLWQPVVHQTHLYQVVVNGIQSFVVAAAIIPGSDFVLRLWLRRHARWAVGDGEPDDADRSDLMRLPARAALAILVLVTLVNVAITTVSLATGSPFRVAAGIGLGFVAVAFTYSLLIYLQTERALRPLYELALTGSGMSERGRRGVRSRFYSSWLLGSAGPLIFILAIPLRSQKGNQLPVVVPMTFMATAGLLLGAMVTLLAGRSVAEPVNQVRRGLQRVQAGDLDLELAVTNPGGLGQLQEGFNAMVRGLRERRTLEDLFGRHVGTEVAKQALAGGMELGGEVRNVTALFVDIIGSTAFAETHPAREVVARVNQLFGVVFAVVSEADGWINKFEGDGCLCVFGAPATLLDHPARGLRAARELGRRLKEIGIDVGVGVACGEVVAGNVGSVERFEYTVLGRPINEASRLTEAAKDHPSRVLATLQAVEQSGHEATKWEPDPVDIELRGVRLPVAVAHPKPENGPG